MADNVLKQPRETQRFDLPAFDRGIETQGVRMTHYRAMRCPHGMIDLDDSRRPRHDHPGCSGGFLYSKAGDLHVLATGNSLVMEPSPGGQILDVPLSVTFGRRYIDPGCEERRRAIVAPYDRFCLSGSNDAELVAEHSQLFQASATGVDRLHFPVTEVVDLLDAGLRHYSFGDFTIADGALVWGSQRPPYDSATDRGSICSIRYTYRPFWYLWQLVHDLRGVRDPDGRSERGWQSGVMRREMYFDSEGGDRFDNSSQRRHAGAEEN